MILAQILQDGSADQLLQWGLNGFVGAVGLGLLWLLRRLPRIDQSVQEFPAQISAVRADVSALRADFAKELDTVRGDMDRELKEISKQITALATDQRVRDARDEGVERRVRQLETRVDGMIERRGSPVQP